MASKPKALGKPDKNLETSQQLSDVPVELPDPYKVFRYVPPSLRNNQQLTLKTRRAPKKSTMIPVLKRKDGGRTSREMASRAPTPQRSEKASLPQPLHGSAQKQALLPHLHSSLVAAATELTAMSSMHAKRQHAAHKSISADSPRISAQSMRKLGGRRSPDHNFNVLDNKLAWTQRLTMWVPYSKKAKRPALKTQPDPSAYLFQLRHDSLKREINSLETFEKEKRKQLVFENYLMTKLKRDRGSLLQRRGQRLPAIEPGGKEQTVMKVERCESPPPQKPSVLTFFNHGNPGNHRKGLCSTMTRLQRGHNVTTEWLGTPHITDVIAKLLGDAPVDVEQLEKEQEKQWPGPEGGDAAHIPLFPALGVVGTSYRDYLKTRQTTQMKSRNQAQVSNLASASTPKGMSVKVPHTINAQSLATTDSYVSTQSKVSLVSSKPPTQTHRVGLMFGNNLLTWSPTDGGEGPPPTKTYVVEVGCTAELGRSSVSSTTLTNTGTVIITYNWERAQHHDKFHLGRYHTERFAFDCWGGTILPGETHRVPCMYKAKDPGFFSEDWCLRTRPVLEGGALITLRMWGLTRQTDNNRRNRESLDKRISSLITRDMAKYHIGKLIDHLPLHDDSLKDIRFPLNILGCDLFHQNNPGFHYHSAAVYRLGKMVNMLDTTFRCSTTPEPSSSTVSTELVSLSGTFSEMSAQAGFVGGQISMEQIGGRASEGNLLERPLAGLHSRVPSEVTTHTTDLVSKRGSALTGHLSKESQMAYDDDVETKSTATAGADTEEDFLPRKLPVEWPARINRLITLWNRHTDQNLHKFTRAPSKGSDSFESRSPSPLHPDKRVNIADCSFQIDALRTKILHNHKLDIQESALAVMSQEVSKLCFRTQEPRDNWKDAMIMGHLRQAMESFSDYAMDLRRVCCMGELRARLSKGSQHSAASVSETAESSHDNIDPQFLPGHSSRVSTVRHEEEQKRLGVTEEQSRRSFKPSSDDDSSRSLDKPRSRSRSHLVPSASPKSVDHNNNESRVKVGTGASSNDIRSTLSRLRESKIKTTGQFSGESAPWSAPWSGTVPDLRITSSLLSENTSNPDEFLDICSKLKARETLSPERYQDQYYSRLHTRMYQLLCDFVDALTTICASSQPELKIDREETTFTRIKNIGLGVNIEDMMIAPPTTPNWMGMAMRLEAVATANHQRIKARPSSEKSLTDKSRARP